MKRFSWIKMGVLLIISSFFLASCTTIRLIPDENLDFLKGQKRIKIQYDYSNLSVGDYEKEADYVKMKVDKYNEDEPGKGEEWKHNWEGDRRSRYQPSFEKLLNDYLEDAGVVVHPSFDEAKYTMIVKTTFIEPGYNIYISKEPAEIDLNIIFVETGKPDVVLGRILVEDSRGEAMGFSDFDSGERIKESYARAGREIGKHLSDIMESD